MAKLNNKKQAGLTKAKLPIPTFLITILLTIMCAIYVYQEQRLLRLDMQSQEVSSLNRILKNIITEDLEYLGTSASFFKALSGTDNIHQQFHDFSAYQNLQHERLQVIQWVQKINPADVPQHLKKIEQVYPDVSPYTILDDNERIEGYDIEAKKPLYLVTDVFPITRISKSVLGFYPSSANFDQVLLDIKKTRKPNISQPIKLIEDGEIKQSNQQGLLVVFPVFADDNIALKGILIGVIRINDYFKELTHRLDKDSKFPIRFLGISSDGDTKFMYESEQWQSTDDVVKTHSIKLFNRELTVEYKLNLAMTMENKSAIIFILLVGTFIAYLLSSIVYILRTQNRHIAQQLEYKTAELKYLVEHDSLTDLLNRRAFNELLHEHIRKKHAFALVSFDIDNFKYINDTFGHPAGDSVLQHLALCIDQLTIEDCDAFRVGGDEFCLMVSRISASKLKYALEGLQQKIADYPCLFYKEKIPYTISIGAAFWDNQGDEMLIQQADSALYESKESGRNCITLYQIEQPENAL